MEKFYKILSKNFFLQFLLKDLRKFLRNKFQIVRISRQRRCVLKKEFCMSGRWSLYKIIHKIAPLNENYSKWGRIHKFSKTNATIKNTILKTILLKFC